MSKVLRGLAQVSLLAIVVSVAPSASAGNKPALPSTDVMAQPSSPTVSRATLLAVRETAAPAEIHAWVDEAVKAHEEAEEDRRVAKVIEAQGEKLAWGRYIWNPERAASGPVEMVVSLKAQRIYVFRERKLIAVSTVSPGRRGNETPVGRFPILQKNRDHFSNLYNNAPMPNMQRMTWDGVALHAGAIPGYPASHGCVRLPMEFSRMLFAITSIGSVVHVMADKPVSAMAALDQATQLAEARARGGGTRARAR